MADTKRRDNKGRLLWDNESQRKDGKYEYKFTDVTGKRKSYYSWKLVSSDRVPKGKRCNESLREIEKRLNRDKEDGIDTYKASHKTLNQAFEENIKVRNLKDTTRTNYKYMYQFYIADVIGYKAMVDIKYSDILTFYNDLIKVKGFKPNSMEIINTIIHPIFTTAVRDGIIRTNPTDGVMVEIKKSHSWEKPKRHALEVEQQSAFIDFVANSEQYNHWLTLFTTMLGTGCRVGEIIGLRWCDCDFEDNMININHNLVYRKYDTDDNARFHVVTPKTKSSVRDIPMFSEVKKALLTERKRQMQTGFNTTVIDGYSGFIFQNREGGVHNPQTTNRAIERCRLACNELELKKAKEEHREPIIVPHFSNHSFRHTFCTRFCENETNVKIIQEIMGHSDSATTMDIYNEATKAKKKESFANLEGKVKIS